MALPRGASARDYWLDLADEARAKTQEALANGNHRMAGLWDEHERALLRNAYDDVPSPNDGATDAGFDPGTEAFPQGIQVASADAPSAFQMAANAKNDVAIPKSGEQPKAAAAAKDLPPEQQAKNLKAARDAMSNPEVFAFMQAISAGEGDYDQLNGGKRFAGWNYPNDPDKRAAGAYQIVLGTYKNLSAQLGLKDFSPDTQDVMAAHLIVRTRGALEAIKQGKIEDAVKKLKPIWVSLPGGGQQNTTAEQFKSRYNANLNRLNGR